MVSWIIDGLLAMAPDAGRYGERITAGILTGVNNRVSPVLQQPIAEHRLGQTGMRGADALTLAAAATMVGCKPIVAALITENLHACWTASLKWH